MCCRYPDAHLILVLILTSHLLLITQLTMLENMFPRHVLEFIMGAAGPEATLGELAYQHDLVGSKECGSD